MNIFYSVIKNSKNSKILLVTLLIGSIFWGGFAYESYNSYKSEIHRAEVETFNLTRVIQEQLNGSFKSTDLILMELQKFVQENKIRSSSIVDPAKQKKLNQYFLEKRLSLSHMRSFKAVDKNGEYIIDDGGLQRYSNLYDREYFQKLKNSDSDVLVISKPIISKTNHIWIIALARRLVDSHGNFDGIVLGTISIDYFTRQFEKLDLREEGLVGLYDNHMVTHMRIPWNEKFLGKPMPMRPQIKDFLEGKEPFFTTRNRSGFDHVDRIMTTRKLGEYGLVVTIGISAENVLMEWKYRTITYFITTIILCGIFVSFLFIFLNSQEQFENQRQQAIQASKLSSLGEMAGGIAHEINNPLTIISALASRTKRNLQDGLPLDKSIDNLDKIVLTVDRIAKIIRGLRSFSRDSNGDAFSYKKVSEIIDMTLDLCQQRLRDNGIILKIEHIPDVQIECREIQIVQVLVNLLNNSLDSIADCPDKWIELTVRDLRTKIEITVIDSGAGIDDGILDKIMMPFFTTKDIGKGTGLGLSISKGIVDAHNGKFYYRLNKGHTSFVLELNKHLSKS
jgi:signal transduction histidine kinase